MVVMKSGVPLNCSDPLFFKHTLIRYLSLFYGVTSEHLVLKLTIFMILSKNINFLLHRLSLTISGKGYQSKRKKYIKIDINPGVPLVVFFI